MKNGSAILTDPVLSVTEKSAIMLGRLNEYAICRYLQFFICRRVAGPIIKKLVDRSIYADNFEYLSQLNPERGVVFVGNHRSFFDLWIFMTVLTIKYASWVKRHTYPVRSNFFYDHPMGIFINQLIGSGSMYPPIFRDPAKSAYNDDALLRLTRFLSVKGSVVGFHPEGTRGKGSDPYELLPAKSGIGRIIQQANPIVIPFFANGLSNSVGEVIKNNRKKDVRENSPVIMTVGQPFDKHTIGIEMKEGDYDNYQVNQAIADCVLDKIKALMPREQELRKACVEGRMNDSDKGWWV